MKQKYSVYLVTYSRFGQASTLYFAARTVKGAWEEAMVWFRLNHHGSAVITSVVVQHELARVQR